MFVWDLYIRSYQALLNQEFTTCTVYELPCQDVAPIQTVLVESHLVYYDFELR